MATTHKSTRVHIYGSAVCGLHSVMALFVQSLLTFIDVSGDLREP